MTTIWQIYKRDIKNIFSNATALIIIIGICILPSLYAWFNIYACWDPYGNTGNLKVAVVNHDKGGTLQGKEINIGDDIVKSLKENKAIGWTFVDSKEADYGLTHDLYYALIEIPDDFSEKITTLISDNPIKPQLIYRVNEKSNAIAPKITGAGSKELLKSVTASFVDEVDKVVFTALNSVGEGIDINKDKILEFRDLIYKLNDNMTNINDTLLEVEEGTTSFMEFVDVVNESMPLIENSITKVQSVSKGIKDITATVKEDFDQSVEAIRIKLLNIQQLNNEFNSLLEDYINSRGDTSNLSDLVELLKGKSEAINTSLQNIVGFLTSLDNNGSLSDIIGSLNNAQSMVAGIVEDLNSLALTISEGYEFNSRLLTDILNTSKELSSTIDEKINSFETTIRPQINNIISGITAVSDNVDELTNLAESQLPVVRELINFSTNTGDLGLKYIETLKNKMPGISASIASLTSQLKEVANNDNINQIVNILTNNPDTISEYISNPVDLVEESIYHIPNYGSAMTPFYTILAIWVGVLIVSSIISTEVHGFEDGTYMSPVSQYFGRMLLFVSIAIIQSLIVALGDIWILGVYTSNTALFISFSVFSSIVFTIVIYTLVSVFGNVGKGFAVILLVLQVAGSGGTFPIEVTPKFFQMLQPYLPFTYAIGSLREAVGGVLWSNVYRDTWTLILFAAIFIVIGILLKRPLMKVVEKMVAKFKKSGISE